MTEIPEHLLKRSKERRSALGLGGDGGSEPPSGASSGPAGASGEGASVPAVAAPAPATTASARPAKAAPAAPPPPPPLPPYVQAAQRRKRIPWWAMPVLAGLPLWGFLYMEAMAPPKVNVETRLGRGAALYAANCSSCHLASGAGSAQGGAGRPLWNGEVLKTWPRIEQQIAFIRHGSFDRGTPYGNPEREGGQHQALTGMPAFSTSTLSDEDLLSIVCHVRISLAGEEPTSEEATTYCAPGATALIKANDEGRLLDASGAELPEPQQVVPSGWSTEAVEPIEGA